MCLSACMSVTLFSTWYLKNWSPNLTEIFSRESRTPIYFGSNGQRSKDEKQCRRGSCGSWRSCGCWLILVFQCHVCRRLILLIRCDSRQYQTESISYFEFRGLTLPVVARFQSAGWMSRFARCCSSSATHRRCAFFVYVHRKPSRRLKERAAPAHR